MAESALPASPTAIIAEDEPLLRQALRDALATAWPELQVLAECENGAEAIDAIAEHRPDVAFLDIRMPGLTGIDVAAAVPEISAATRVVFVTAFEQHALEAFDRGAIDYLLKPLQPARLARTVARLKESPGLDAATVAARVRTLPPPPVVESVEPLRWITVQRGRELQLITVDDVVYFRADHKYVAVVTADSEALISLPLKELAARLDGERFWQVHRSTIVNVQAIKSVSRSLSGKLSIALKSRPESLEVSPTYAHRFKQL